MSTIHTHGVHHGGRGGVRGIALISVLLLMIVLFLIVGAMAAASWTENQFTEREENLTKALYAGESGVALAENAVWNAYLNSVGGNPGVIADYQDWANNNTPFANGATVNLGGLPVALDGMTNVTNVAVTRTDSIARTLYNIVATGQDRFGNPQTVTEQLLVEGRKISDVNFGMLARNMECVFCHTEIDSAPRVFNTNPSRYGTFERVRVAAQGHIVNKDPKDPGASGIFDTRIAGTLYLRGPLSNKADGAPMTQGEINASDMNGYLFNSANDYVVQNGAGATTTVSLQQAPTSAGVLQPGGNLYMDYPTNPAGQTDGVVPQTIPTVFRDVDNNLIVSGADVADRWANISSEVQLRAPGAISGGTIYNVPIGNTYPWNNLPPVGNLAAVDAAGSGIHTGNVVMVGTAGNPLLLDKTVLIDGDLIITGVVKGEGQVYVSGNIYIVGDITYDNGPQWGRAADGTKNLLMLRAGGNILVNDFLTPQRTYNGSQPGSVILPAGSGVAAFNDPNTFDTGNHTVAPPTAVADWWSPTMEQITFYNRNEWMFTQQKLQKNNGIPGTTPGLTNNTQYDMNYRPRYLVMDAGSPVYVYAFQVNSTDVYPGSPGKIGAYWNDAQGYWRGDPRPVAYQIYEDVSLSPTGQVATGGTNGNGVLNAGEDQDGDGALDYGPLVRLTAADVANQNGAVVQMMPNGGWISAQKLKNLWIDDNTARAAGAAITIEAGLHADNTIIAMARTFTRYGHKSYGQLTINGLVMARNIGIIAPGDQPAGYNTGFRLRYDPRLIVFKEGVVTFPVEATRLAKQYN